MSRTRLQASPPLRLVSPTSPPSRRGCRTDRERGDAATAASPGRRPRTSTAGVGEHPAAPAAPAERSRKAAWIIGVAVRPGAACSSAAPSPSSSSVSGEDKHSIAITATAGGMKRDTAKETAAQAAARRAEQQFKTQAKNVILREVRRLQPGRQQARPRGRTGLPRRQADKVAEPRRPSSTRFSKQARPTASRSTKIAAGDGGGKAVCASQSTGQKVAICAWATKDTIGELVPTVPGYDAKTALQDHARPAQGRRDRPSSATSVLTRWGRALDRRPPAPGVPTPPARPRTRGSTSTAAGSTRSPRRPTGPRRTTARSWCRSPPRPSSPGSVASSSPTSGSGTAAASPHPSPTGGRVLLHFGAVDQTCTVWVNGAEVGVAHRRLPAVHPRRHRRTRRRATNLLEVRVRDLSETGVHARGKQRLDRGEIWYTAQSGIWQTVWLEAVPAAYVERLVLAPHLETGELEVTVVAARRAVADVQRAWRLALDRAGGDGDRPGRCPGPASRSPRCARGRPRTRTSTTSRSRWARTGSRRTPRCAPSASGRDDDGTPGCCSTASRSRTSACSTRATGPTGC